MARKTETIALLSPAPGTRHEVVAHRYGTPGARPKAYLQAALHADEIPAIMAQHHLMGLLDAADAAGAITGEIVLVPYANPIGLAQWLNGHHMGRHDLPGGGNFNRDWPDFFPAILDEVGPKLTRDEAGNVAVIREALGRVVAGLTPSTPMDSLRGVLAGLAYDADLVFDLHCDDDSLMHLFLIPAHWPEGEDLSAELGCRAVLLAEDSGGGSFDEAFSVPWTRLAAHYPDHPIPAACLAMTVEFRGRADVFDRFGEQDGKALFRLLQRRGLVAGDPGALPSALCEATRLDACDVVKTPAAGVLAYKVALGDRVTKGQTIAEVIDPTDGDLSRARRPIATRADGMVLSRRMNKLVRPGEAIAKVVGKQTLSHRRSGSLLED